MSEYPIDELSREDRAALAALEHLAGGRTVPPGAADEELAREYLEALCALPRTLEPVTPAPEVKARFLATVRDQATASAAETATTPPAPSNVVPIAPSSVVPRALAAAPPLTSNFNPWAGALAALFVLCLLGLGYLAGRMGEQARTIARLDAEVQAVREGPAVETLNEQLVTLKRRFNMVNSIARQAYKMKGETLVGTQAAPPEGVVYVCGQHQRWYLNLQGLEEPPPGKEYNLWFLTRDGMVNGGVVDVKPDASSERDAESMPEDTHGFAISLEDVGEHDKPEGIMVLLGEEAVSL